MAREAVGGGLYWGIKSSFIRYFSRTPDGEFALLNGAEVTTDTLFFFPLKTGPEPSTTVTLEFQGEARFVAYAGVLRVSIANPALELSENGGSLTVDDWTAPQQRISLVTVDALPGSPRPGEDIDRCFRSQLTDAGAAVFGGNYRAGEPFDDLHLRLSAG